MLPFFDLQGKFVEQRRSDARSHKSSCISETSEQPKSARRPKGLVKQESF